MTVQPFEDGHVILRCSSSQQTASFVQQSQRLRKRPRTGLSLHHHPWLLCGFGTIRLPKPVFPLKREDKKRIFSTIHRADWYLVISLGKMNKPWVQTNQGGIRRKPVYAHRHLWRRVHWVLRMPIPNRRMHELGNQPPVPMEPWVRLVGQRLGVLFSKSALCFTLGNRLVSGPQGKHGSQWSREFHEQDL